MLFKQTNWAIAVLVASQTSALANVDASSEQAIVALMVAEGYQAKLEYLDDGEPVIRSSESGSDFSIYFHDCTNGTACKSIQYFTAYDMDAGMTMERANNWNRQFRFGKVYLSLIHI